MCWDVLKRRILAQRCIVGVDLAAFVIFSIWALDLNFDAITKVNRSLVTTDHVLETLLVDGGANEEH